ncbi:metallophosphoesterase [Jannaschia sp. KMU-145]|uniref:metallophosphoesterase n=1 Tax=Jannaschia halovivens TaxID=3388667 RepID=UPI00396B1004
MLKTLSKRLGRSATGSVFDAALRPDTRTYVVGDIHGRLDLLHGALAFLDGDIAENGPDCEIVFLGDYVDRGETSAGVLALLQGIEAACPVPATVLMGNHERMMLDFMDQPVVAGRRWLVNGGLQTAASFGVAGLTDRAGPKALVAARAAIAEAMPDGMLRWLERLPLMHRSGNLVCVHAGADPDVPIDAQDKETLLWGHRAFTTTPRRDGLWIAHGHHIVETPTVTAGRIAVDTGAYHSGRLTIGILDTDRIDFHIIGA